MDESVSPPPLAITFLPLQGALAASIFIPARETQAPFLNKYIIKCFLDFNARKKNPFQSVTLSVPNECVSKRCRAILFHPGSFCLSLRGGGNGKKCILRLISSLFLSMLACVSVRIHHASLGVDQGENTSLFLPALPPLSSSCPHLTLMAVVFLMRKWVSLCSVSVEGSPVGGVGFGGDGGRRRDVLVQNTSPG